MVRPAGDKVEPAGGLIHMMEGHIQPFGRKLVPQTLGPLDETDPFAVKVLVKTEFYRIVPARQAVEVEMVQTDPPGIFVQQRKGGARDGNRRLDTDSCGHPPGKMGLAAAELSVQGDKSAGGQHPPEALAEKYRFIDAAGKNGNHGAYFTMVLMRSMRETMPTSFLPSTTGRV